MTLLDNSKRRIATGNRLLPREEQTGAIGRAPAAETPAKGSYPGIFAGGQGTVQNRTTASTPAYKRARTTPAIMQEQPERETVNIRIPVRREIKSIHDVAAQFAEERAREACDKARAELNHVEVVINTYENPNSVYYHQKHLLREAIQTQAEQKAAIRRLEADYQAKRAYQEYAVSVKRGTSDDEKRLIAELAGSLMEAAQKLPIEERGIQRSVQRDKSMEKEEITASLRDTWYNHFGKNDEDQGGESTDADDDKSWLASLWDTMKGMFLSGDTTGVTPTAEPPSPTPSPFVLRPAPSPYILKPRPTPTPRPPVPYDVRPFLERYHGIDTGNLTDPMNDILDAANVRLLKSLRAGLSTSADVDGLAALVKISAKVEDLRKKGINRVAVYDQDQDLDCSSFVQDVYDNFGMYVPGSSINQRDYYQAKGWDCAVKQGSDTSELDNWDYQVGDILFWSHSGTETSDGDRHTAIYVGNGCIIDSGGGSNGNNHPSGVYVYPMEDVNSTLIMCVRPEEDYRLTLDDINGYLEDLDE